jgi:hypothetical protein
MAFKLAVFEDDPNSLEPGMRITADDGFVQIDGMITSLEYDENNKTTPVVINLIGYYQ